MTRHSQHCEATSSGYLGQLLHRPTALDDKHSGQQYAGEHKYKYAKEGLA